MTNGSVRGGMLVGQLELGLAALGAEVDGLALVPERGRAGYGGHGHPADRVDGGRRGGLRGGRGGGAPAPPPPPPPDPGAGLRGGGGAPVGAPPRPRLG